MFDDPRNELRELEDRLLAAEAPRETPMLDEQEFEALYDEILEEYGHQDDAPQPPIRNFANGYGRQAPQEIPRPQTEPLTPESQPRGNGGLVLTLCLEIAAIAAVVIFWILSLLGV